LNDGDGDGRLDEVEEDDVGLAEALESFLPPQLAVKPYLPSRATKAPEHEEEEEKKHKKKNNKKAEAAPKKKERLSQAEAEAAPTCWRSQVLVIQRALGAVGDQGEARAAAAHKILGDQVTRVTENKPSKMSIEFTDYKELRNRVRIPCLIISSV
jgi:hypothetical protein